MRIRLPRKYRHPIARLCHLTTLVTISSALTSCSDVGIPDEIKTAHVDVATVKPELTRFGGDSRLGLVLGLARGRADTSVLAVGEALCAMSATDAAIQCEKAPLVMEAMEALSDSVGRVNGLVVSGPMGRPSAARLSLRGDQLWRVDGDVGNMGSFAVADLADGRAVLISGSDSIAVIDYATGKARGKRPRGRAMLGDDWIGDARREYLYSPDDSTFLLIGAGDSTRATLRAPSVWPEPVITPTTDANPRPFLVTSAGSRLDVYDSLLTKVRSYDAIGMKAPMHVMAATFIGPGPAAPLAVVFGGANDWHRSVLFLFGSNGAIAYKEVLEDDHHVLRPVTDATGVTFLLGGRGVVWQYRFPIGM
jgi:hypothetical protein